MPTSFREAVVSILPWAFLLFFLFVLIGGILNLLFLRRLRDHHSQVWEELGSPTLFLNNSARNQLLTMGFVWSGRSRILGDRTLRRMVLLNRVLTIVAVTWFTAMIAAGIAFEQ